MFGFLFFLYSFSSLAGYVNPQLLWSSSSGDIGREVKVCVLRKETPNKEEIVSIINREYAKKTPLYFSTQSPWENSLEAEDFNSIPDSFIQDANRALKDSFGADTTFVYFSKIEDCVADYFLETIADRNNLVESLTFEFFYDVILTNQGCFRGQLCAGLGDVKKYSKEAIKMGYEKRANYFSGALVST